MIDVKNVKSFEMRFGEIVKCFASLTEWPNGGGWTVNLTTGEQVVSFEATDDMLDALGGLHIYATTYKEPTDAVAE